MSLRIYFARHGESEANVLKIFSNRGWKHPLTDRGRQQVKSLAQKLQNRGVVAIYTSPLQRAVESAQIVADLFELSFEIETALAEYDVGIYEGLSFAEHAEKYYAVEQQWADGRIRARLERGESSCDVCNRVEPFVRQLVKNFASRQNAGVLLMGHGGTFRQAIPAVVPNISRLFAHQRRLDNAAFVEAELSNGSLRRTRWADEIVE